MSRIDDILDVNKRLLVGSMFSTFNDFDTAIAVFETVLEKDPDNHDALCNLASHWLKKREAGQALRWANRAVAAWPESARASGTAALAAQEVSLFVATNFWMERAEVLFKKSLALEPKNVTTILNYAYYLQVCGRFNEALEQYSAACDLNPLDLNSRFQRSLCLLTLASTREEWKRAYEEYEIRGALISLGHQFPKPRYTLEAHGNSRPNLLLVAEQGIGDTVMTARYVRYLKATTDYTKIYILCKPSCVGILSAIVNADGVYDNLEDVPDYDFYVPMMSLPGLFGSVSCAYYHSTPANILERGRRPRIGVCWKGNPEHGNDRWRSIDKDTFLSYFAALDADIISLQRPDDNGSLPMHVKDVKSTGLLGLSKFIAGLDLVVTVDTAVLHIAGAQGVPTFALIPSNPDWRWQTEGRKTRWYRSVTLFRQSKPQEWSIVLRQVRDAVNSYIEERNKAWSSNQSLQRSPLPQTPAGE